MDRSDSIFAMYGASRIWLDAVGLPDQSIGANDRHAPVDDEPAADAHLEVSTRERRE